MKERNLVRRKAASMDLNAVLLEIDRINHGLACAQGASARNEHGLLYTQTDPTFAAARIERVAANRRQRKARSAR